mmetsp:Transcript_14557/g.24149  ORF Transcript_14557/g.24149 Transcript_14557/m.24149 type:complete len:183 (+) Transcript_14557:63-611(+)
MRKSLLLLHYSLFTAVVHALTTLTTTSTIRGISVRELQDYLATPTHWPTIVASSVGVESFSSLSGKKKKSNPVDRPQRVGDQVREVFGLPPVIPLSVVWTCRQNKYGSLEFVAPEGLVNVATNCRMAFAFRQDDTTDDTTTVVDLTVEYEPVSFLAILAMPVLSLDNELALKGLLPLALSRR